MTSLATLAGREVIEGRLWLPLSGVWTAELELDADEAPSGQVELVIAGDGADSASYLGVVARSSAPAGRALVTVVGGRTGGLSAEPALAIDVEGQHYDGEPDPVTAALLLGDICAAAGETLDPASVALLGAFQASSWQRQAEPARVAVGRVLGFWALSARILPGADLWAGIETWPAAAEDPEEVDPIDDGRVLFVAPRSALIQPGQVVGDRRIRRVEYLIADALRARLHYAEDA